MLHPRGDEKQVAGGKGVALRAVRELAAARDHDVHLVAGVRLLGIGPPRRVELDAEAAALEGAVQRLNRGRPDNEQLHFSYGIGYGDVLDLDEDMFGLEVNLASKLGEDLADPGEALLTPSAAAAVDAATLKRLVPFRVITFGTQSVPIQRLKLRTGARKGKVPTRKRITP